MIRGLVNSNREATISLRVQGPTGSERELEAVIDTGFTGFLTMPADQIAELELVWRGRERAMLADGQIYVFDVYDATIVWDGQPRTVETDATDASPLVGMGLLYGHDIRIQAVEGGLVTIETLR